jgi:hypothetical protein
MTSCDQEMKKPWERYYDSKRQSPVLDKEDFVEKLRGQDLKLVREISRYHRHAVQVHPDRVIRKVAGTYGISKDEVLKGGASSTERSGAQGDDVFGESVLRLDAQ